MADPIKAYGWTAMPRKVETLLATSTNVKPPAPVSVRDISLPDSPLAKAVHEYAKKELAAETFNHSMRVFYYGMYLVQH
jgi:cyanamide hydratase